MYTYELEYCVINNSFTFVNTKLKYRSLIVTRTYIIIIMTISIRTVHEFLNILYSTVPTRVRAFANNGDINYCNVRIYRIRPKKEL